MIHLFGPLPIRAQEPSMKWLHLFGWCIVILITSESAGAGDTPAGSVPEAVQSITAREIGGHLRFLASDLMRGRDTGSPEIRLAGEYLAAHLFAAGAEPMGDRDGHGVSYFQTFPLEVVTPLEEGTGLTLILDLNGARREVRCNPGGDLIVYPHGLVPGEVEAPLVFAGYGRDNPEKKIDDYEQLEVRDHYVLVYDGQPEDAKSPANAPAQRPVLNAGWKLGAAQKRGALGMIVIQAPGRKTPAPQVPYSARNLGFGRPNVTPGTSRGAIPLLYLADSIRDLLVNTLGLAPDSKPHALAQGSVRARFRFAARKEPKHERNVLGFFPGSDPEKKKEVIIYSAHYDHVGVNEKGEIFNGSDDNASGTSSLLEIAEAFGQSPKPARSVAFVWVSGEEKGLWGSHYFADHLTFPEHYRIVADINLDMVSRNDPKKIGITPSPRHSEYNSLVPAAQDSCRAEGMEAVFNADEFFFRTDSSSFAIKGVPVIFFFAGIHADYHRPTDDYAKADLEKAARVARTAYRLGWHFAQGGEAPKKIKAESTPSASQTASAP
jgi:Peptidase family M28